MDWKILFGVFLNWEKEGVIEKKKKNRSNEGTIPKLFIFSRTQLTEQEIGERLVILSLLKMLNTIQFCEKYLDHIIRHRV